MEKLETDVEIKAPAKKFHDVFCTKVHDIPTMSSNKIPKTEHHEGELGSEGAILTWHYVRGTYVPCILIHQIFKQLLSWLIIYDWWWLDGKVETVKTVVEKIDAEKNAVRFKVVEGDLLKEFKWFVSAVQVSPKGNGEGSVVHWDLEFEKIHDKVPHPHSLIDLVIGMSKDIDTFLIGA